jgi:ABC-type polysaccharide/polyol phosphate export permease
MRYITKGFAVAFLAVFAIITGAMLVAIQVRLRIILGKPLGEEYLAQPLSLFIILLMSAATSTWMMSRTGRLISRISYFMTVLLALGFSTLITVLLLPDVSLLQLVYFNIFGVLIGSATILLPPRPIRDTDFFYHLAKLWENRVLLSLWVRYNVRSRYSQTFLGIAWIILLPLSTSFIMAFVFSQIFPARFIGDVPFISFFLSAVTAWNVFSQGILNGTTSLTREMGLMSQIYFPREILVIVKLGETLVDFTFTFAAMLVVNAIFGVWPNENFIYLPAVILIQVIFTLGLMMFVSYITVMVRDIPQLVAVSLQLLFYLTPIIYSVQSIPANLSFMLLINPIALIIDAYRSIIVYNTPPDPVNLYYPLVMAGVLLYTGYMFFKAYEKRLVDYV